MRTRFLLVTAVALVLTSLAVTAAPAGDIIAEWSSVKAPPASELKPVTLETKTTALLILDMMRSNCGQRPRCLAVVPNVKKLHDQARAAGMMIFYSLVSDDPTPGNIVDTGLTPREGEWARVRGPDKFMGSGLDDKLKARGIKTVIVCGTSAQGVVIGTGSGSAQRGYKVIVPVDCMSSEDLYMEQYTAFHMAKGGPAVVTEKTTVTRSDMIKF
jgi:nicotinamidase-related amidase